MRRTSPLGFNYSKVGPYDVDKLLGTRFQCQAGSFNVFVVQGVRPCGDGTRQIITRPLAGDGTVRVYEADFVDMLNAGAIEEVL